jgi:hypothetical protein
MKDLLKLAIEEGNDKAIELLIEQIAGERTAKSAMYAALAKFHEQKPEIKKISKVSFQLKNGGKKEYHFAPLPYIQKLLDPILSKNGLTYFYTQYQEGQNVFVKCTLCHVEGAEISTKLWAPADVSGNKNSIQSVGSTLTYLQRYTLVALLGLSSDEDNDGNTSDDPKSPKKTEPKKESEKKLETKTKPKITKTQLDSIINRIVGGEKGMLTKAQKNFTLTAEQHKLILDTELNYDESNK